MMNKMVVANLAHRPIRSLISIVAIALEVTLILLIVGLCYCLMNDSKNRTAGIGADVIVQPPGSSFLSGVSGAPVSIKVADVLARMQHVKVVSPVIWQIATVLGALAATYFLGNVLFTFSISAPQQAAGAAVAAPVVIVPYCLMRVATSRVSEIEVRTQTKLLASIANDANNGLIKGPKS